MFSSSIIVRVMVTWAIAHMVATWVIARMAVTWAIARKAVELILPTSLETLKALTWGMVCSEVPSLQIEMVWRPIQARHRQFQMRQTLFATNLYLSWVKMLSSVRGPAAVSQAPGAEAGGTAAVGVAADLASSAQGSPPDGGGDERLLEGQ